MTTLAIFGQIPVVVRAGGYKVVEEVPFGLPELCIIFLGRGDFSKLRILDNLLVVRFVNCQSMVS